MLTFKSAKNWMLVAVVALFAFELAGVKQARAQDWSLQQVKSSANYAQTVAKVKKLVAKSGMMILGEVNQGKILSMTGLKLKAVSLFIGNPTMGKKIFSASPGVGIAIPVRLNIFEGRDGHVYVNYYKPSAQLSAFRSKPVAMMGNMLDQKLAKLTSMLTK